MWPFILLLLISIYPNHHQLIFAQETRLSTKTNTSTDDHHRNGKNDTLFKYD